MAFPHDRSKASRLEIPEESIMFGASNMSNIPVPFKPLPCPSSDFLRKTRSFVIDLSNWEDAELLVYLVDEEKDIYIGVLVVVCHLEPVLLNPSATSV
jgi:hypothetical protein